MYWWVNLSQARRHELEAGYLWSAVPAMRRARAGDIVFVHAGGQVAQQQRGGRDKHYNHAYVGIYASSHLRPDLIGQERSV